MQNPFKGSLSIDFYTNQSTIKWLILVVAVVIGGSSIIYTNRLVNELKEGEREKIRLWAAAVEYQVSADVDISALTFITTEIITPKNTLPVILLDSASNNIDDFRNIDVEGLGADRQEAKLRGVLEKMKGENKPFQIISRNGPNGSISDISYVYYRNSRLLRQLSTYPYVQLTVIGIFGFIAYLAFSYSRTSEQNRVWVGLAKETAHQLGTPLSSLMAWVEYLQTIPEMEGRTDIVTELQKDVHRLEMITSRFSNIGSEPSLKDEDVLEAVNNTVSYLKPRVSSKVSFEVESLADGITAKMNKPLFEWVVENIVKNGIDAMSGIGSIKITVGRESGKGVFIDIEDNGKGIAKGKAKEVFKPGFTTKKRGWGLGLTLVQRIVENYHSGRIFVKFTQVDVGTVFRIVLTS